MSLSSLLSKLRYGSYKYSSNASVYEEIARSYSVSPQHVYEIAHGKKIHVIEDDQIFQELLAMGIIVNRFV